MAIPETREGEKQQIRVEKKTEAQDRTSNVSNTRKSYIDRASDHLTTQLLDYLKIDVDTTRPIVDGPHTTTSATSSTKEGTLEDTPLYNSIRKAVKWQRDNYLVGRQFADERRKERKAEEDMGIVGAGVLPSSLGFDETALGNPQLRSIGAWYITSSSLYDVALPFVLTLPMGPLYTPALRASVDLIPMGQQPLDNVTKQSVIDVLGNENIKGFVKSSYISRIYRDSPN
mmetsp:Transcript_38664/g.57484  ORF Transcript_38664/g.57484 Transcript_38664/m.57484 type:complete len:229 (-) Transcript_38664:707-1393(-)